MEVRSVKINIPEIIADYIFAKNDKDAEGCKEIRERFEKVYAESSSALQFSITGYIMNLLDCKGLNNTNDLDGLFSAALS